MSNFLFWACMYISAGILTSLLFMLWAFRSRKLHKNDAWYYFVIIVLWPIAWVVFANQLLIKYKEMRRPKYHGKNRRMMLILALFIIGHWRIYSVEPSKVFTGFYKATYINFWGVKKCIITDDKNGGVL